jgi:hypothetical protein
MPGRSRKHKNRTLNAIPLAAPLIDRAAGDTLLEQPLVDEGQKRADVAPGPAAGFKGGKARATRLGKAKLSAIAKKVTRSRWKKKG